MVTDDVEAEIEVKILTHKLPASVDIKRSINIAYINARSENIVK